uniref:EGF-like domain-containing protein n=1 Tax=Chromera velia CCMP2878 TaxID=1169474 RepID=A0A0G4FC76_9ALVE|eukprot:Cvel_3192.t1-p1 / transcript=Cvel_3192.t1 / gene=Cvel_3192 / organism=Chromera_velia_CCMP2878 / gene_product=Fibropellin-1, putative / transcript_product=Fibropellin-1, putative / location=Cvel_scaffold124:90213-97575(-) / protein_length=191 / sequence_SO=supercontig / SO=protein_coding / is_pseudo=false
MKRSMSAIVLRGSEAHLAPGVGHLRGSRHDALASITTSNGKFADNLNRFKLSDSLASRTKDVEACEVNPYANGGVYEDTGMGADDFICSCPYPFYGPTCELTIEVNNCEGVTCQNGSTCIDISGSPTGQGYVCDCLFPFTGQFCKIEQPPETLPQYELGWLGGFPRNSVTTAFSSSRLPTLSATNRLLARP